MTAPQQGPLVSAVAFEAMDAEQIAVALRVGAFAVVGLGARTVVGARPVPGHPATTTREAAFWRIPGSSAWAGCVNLRYPHPRAGELTRSPLNAPGARYPALTTQLVAHIRWIRTLDELEAWVGGVCSQPIDDAERAAILAGKV
jgi:hypothetical protein